MNIGEYLFTESEVKEVASLINEIVATVKKHNPTSGRGFKAKQGQNKRIENLLIFFGNSFKTFRKQAFTVCIKSTDCITSFRFIACH